MTLMRLAKSEGVGACVGFGELLEGKETRNDPNGIQVLQTETLWQTQEIA